LNLGGLPAGPNLDLSANPTVLHTDLSISFHLKG